MEKPLVYINAILSLSFYLFIFYLLRSKFSKSKKRYKQMNEGEIELYNRLKPFESKDFKLIANPMFKVVKGNGKTTQIDLIAINQKGIFVFEMKDYSGKIYGDRDDAKWRQYLVHSKQTYPFYNPIKQNEMHIWHLKNILSNMSLNVPMHSVIVFADKTNIYSLDLPEVMRVSDVSEYVRRFNGPDALTGSEIREVAKRLNSLSKDSWFARKKHVKYAKRIRKNAS